MLAKESLDRMMQWRPNRDLVAAVVVLEPRRVRDVVQVGAPALALALALHGIVQVCALATLPAMSALKKLAWLPVRINCVQELLRNIHHDNMAGANAHRRN